MLSPRLFLHRWSRDVRGTAPERWALIAGGIAVVCVAGARVADTVVKTALLTPQGPTRTAGAAPDTSSLLSRFSNGTVDYTVTSSIAAPAGAVHLDPCTGQSR